MTTFVLPVYLCSILSLTTILVGFGEALQFADRCSITLTLWLTLTAYEAPESVKELSFIKNLYIQSVTFVFFVIVKDIFLTSFYWRKNFFNPHERTTDDANDDIVTDEQYRFIIDLDITVTWILGCIVAIHFHRIMRRKQAPGVVDSQRPGFDLLDSPEDMERRHGFVLYRCAAYAHARWRENYIKAKRLGSEPTPTPSEYSQSGGYSRESSRVELELESTVMNSPVEDRIVARWKNEEGFSDPPDAHKELLPEFGRKQTISDLKKGILKTTYYNINQPLADLPPSAWEENVASIKAALETAMNHKKLNTIQQASEVHENWVKRASWLEADSILRAPFNDLPRDEQMKDLVVVNQCASFVNLMGMIHNIVQGDLNVDNDDQITATERSP